MTFELMCGIVHTLWAMGRVESVLVVMWVMLCFCLYLRPGEPHRVQCRHIVAPMKSPSGSKHVTVVLNRTRTGRQARHTSTPRVRWPTSHCCRVWERGS